MGSNRFILEMIHPPATVAPMAEMPRTGDARILRGTVAMLPAHLLAAVAIEPLGRAREVARALYGCPCEDARRCRKMDFECRTSSSRSSNRTGFAILTEERTQP